jgi:proline iminopeptidase
MTPPTAVSARLTESQRGDFDRITDADLEQPDPEIQATYSRAVYPAWFADAEMAHAFTPPKVTSATGAVILARLRRDGYDWRSRLRALSVPTLVIHGEDDVLPVSVSAELADLLPRATRLLVPRSGHMPFWEAPEALFPAVESFLAAPMPGSVRRSV